MAHERELISRLKDLSVRVNKLETWESVSCESQAALFGKPYATKVVAPYNSLATNKERADVVLTGADDQILLSAIVEGFYLTGDLYRGRVLILDGDVFCSDSWTIPNFAQNIEFEGMGTGTRLHMTGASLFNLIEFTADSYNIAIRNMWLEGSGTSGSVGGSSGIGTIDTTVKMNSLELENLLITDFHDHGIEIATLLNSRLHQVFTGRNGLDGINIINLYNTMIQRCKMFFNENDGLYVLNSRGSQIRNNHSYNNGGYGMWVQWSDTSAT